MGHGSHELKLEIQKNLDRMRTMRDEVRVQLHLAGMDVRDEWNRLEPHLVEVERVAQEFTDASKTALDGALKRLEALRSSMLS